VRLVDLLAATLQCVAVGLVGCAQVSVYKMPDFVEHLPWRNVTVVPLGP